MKRIAIIGAGASGMFTAINAKTQNNEIIVFESMPRVGKKLLATGNGRCNITNEKVDEIDENGELIHFHSNQQSFPRFALEHFTNHDLLNFFKKYGMMFRNENDKYFPFSEQAGTVLDILRFLCEKKKIKIRTDCKISSILVEQGKYVINNQSFDNLVIACGGKSSSHFGTDGSGYKILESFGHKCSTLFPAITQIKTDTTFVKQLKGIKVDANCKISVEGKFKREEFGQVLFADYGLSGPPIFQLSRIASEFSKKNCEISLDFTKDIPFNETMILIQNIIKNPFCENMTAENLLTPIFNKRLGQIIVKKSNIALSTPVSLLSAKDIKLLASNIKSFKLSVQGVQGFNNAQVTAGGIYTKDFDEKTMQSKLKKGLYACGEVLDVDGDCGGYNLQWAFSSAYIVAKALTGENK